MSLSFVSNNSLWYVASSDSYENDCKVGQSHAHDYIAACRADPDSAPRLGHIAQQQALAGAHSGVEVGFWQALQERLA